MVEIRLAASETDLKGILNLQKKNLSRNLLPTEVQEHGFVTVDHSFEQMAHLQAQEPHVISLADDRVVGYVLAMTIQAADLIPVLRPMFQLFGQVQIGNTPLNQLPYIVVGQVCVAKEQRGSGLFDLQYEFYRQYFSTRYQLAVTEIDLTNARSLRAHQRLGFEILDTYQVPSGTTWAIVGWDWRKGT